MKRLLIYATFYTTSNRVVIIMDNIINLLGSHWLLGLSVLEVKSSDWWTSRDRWRFFFFKENKLGCFFGSILNRLWCSGSEFSSVWQLMVETRRRRREDFSSEQKPEPDQNRVSLHTS